MNFQQCGTKLILALRCLFKCFQISRLGFSTVSFSLMDLSSYHYITYFITLNKYFAIFHFYSGQFLVKNRKKSLR